MNTFLQSPSLLVAFFAASTSGAVILIHVFGWIRLAYSAWILAPLTAIVFIALCVQAGWRHEEVFINRLWGGVVAGAVGLVAYDLVRLLILLSGRVPFNPFRPIEVYGLLILDRYQDSLMTKTVGWGFHIWNGLSFAAMYTLTVGRGRVLWGLGWGMVLEVAMLSSYPSIFRMAMEWPFLLVSFTGHVAYGLAIGLTARRVVQW